MIPNFFDPHTRAVIHAQPRPLALSAHSRFPFSIRVVVRGSPGHNDCSDDDGVLSMPMVRFDLERTDATLIGRRVAHLTG